jgi:hypothetical protein
MMAPPAQGFIPESWRIEGRGTNHQGTKTPREEGKGRRQEKTEEDVNGSSLATDY